MRGKPVGGLKLEARGGITPAHAGKTVRNRFNDAVNEDHPRACGENYN